MQAVGVSSYQSKYGADQLKKNYSSVESANIKETPKDSFNPKYKSKKKMGGVLGTILLVGLTAFGVYKGHGKISNGIKKLVEQGGKFKKKCPNITQAGESFAKACETPKKYVVDAGKKVAKPIKSVWASIKGFFTKKA